MRKFVTAHSPNYLLLFFVSILLGPFIATLAFISPVAVSSLDLSMDRRFLNGLGISYVIGIPVAVIAYSVLVGILCFKKSLFPISVGFIGGCICIVVFHLVSLNGSYSVFDTLIINGHVFLVGFVPGTLCYLIASKPLDGWTNDREK